MKYLCYFSLETWSNDHKAVSNEAVPSVPPRHRGAHCHTRTENKSFVSRFHTLTTAFHAGLGVIRTQTSKKGGFKTDLKKQHLCFSTFLPTSSLRCTKHDRRRRFLIQKRCREYLPSFSPLKVQITSPSRGTSRVSH